MGLKPLNSGTRVTQRMGLKGCGLTDGSDRWMAAATAEAAAAPAATAITETAAAPATAATTARAAAEWRTRDANASRVLWYVFFFFFFFLFFFLLIFIRTTLARAKLDLV